MNHRMILADVLLHVLLVICSLFGALSQGDSYDAEYEYCEGLSADTRVVSTAVEASTLGEDLDRCKGLEFNVYWRGSILLGAPLELTNSTTLRVSGDSTETSLVDGGDEVNLFVVSELSVLHLEGLGLTAGYGDNGGAVAAVGGASVTLVDCNIYGNRATSNGGV